MEYCFTTLGTWEEIRKNFANIILRNFIKKQEKVCLKQELRYFRDRVTISTGI